jgi:predicted N-acetyltransferase YhbS
MAPCRFEFSPLCEVPHHGPALAASHAREWQHLYANWNEQTALAEFHAETAGADIPATWVLHDPTRGLIGSVSLVLDDLPARPDLAPWLASLYVLPPFRGLGCGRRLVNEALRRFDLLGYDGVYLFTESRMSYFSKLGFVPIDTALAERVPVTIMRRSKAR